MAKDVYSELSAFKPYFEASTSKPQDDTPHWFQMIPMYVTSSVPVSNTNVWSAPCFQFNNITSQINPDGTASISIYSDLPTSLLCEDFYLLATLEAFQFKIVERHGFQSVTTWHLSNVSDAEMFDIKLNGFRLFRFLGSPVDVLDSIYATIELFMPEICCGPGVNPKYAAANVAFLQDYANFTFAPRNINVVDINETDVFSGDFIGVTRMDGLDPMIDFGMGGTTGHTTVTLWIEGVLHVCESTVNSVYWPTNGVQCTIFSKWIDQARAASYNFVHVPLSDEMRSKFNETAAYEFFKTVAGLPYGYHNFLFGWLDTAYDNFPCMPPNYNECLSPQAVMVASGLMNQLSPAIAQLMWIEAFNFRLDTNLNSTADIYQAAAQKGLNFTDLITIPELDSWMYSTGKSMVCDVFVCNMWRAGGIVGDDFQCAELTPRDVYSMNVFDTSSVRPSQCVQADPDLPFCQLGGDYRLELPGYNTIEPFANMGNNCPGLPPKYERPVGC